MSDGRLEPPPSADPGADHERILRDIRSSSPKFGCLGKTFTGTSALLAMGALVGIITLLLRRRA